MTQVLRSDGNADPRISRRGRGSGVGGGEVQMKGTELCRGLKRQQAGEES